MRLIKNNLVAIIAITYFLIMGVVATSVAAPVTHTLSINETSLLNESFLSEDGNLAMKKKPTKHSNNSKTSLHDYKKHFPQLKKSTLSCASITELKVKYELSSRTYKSFHFQTVVKHNRNNTKRLYHLKTTTNNKHQF